jgi:hypothetical protein
MQMWQSFVHRIIAKVIKSSIWMSAILARLGIYYWRSVNQIESLFNMNILIEAKPGVSSCCRYFHMHYAVEMSLAVIWTMQFVCRRLKLRRAFQNLYHYNDNGARKNKHLDDLKSTYLLWVHKQLCSLSSYDGTHKEVCSYLIRSNFNTDLTKRTEC